MKYLKMLGLAAVAAMALTAFTAGSASATTLEAEGSAKSSAVTISASLQKESSAVLRTTGGLFANTCLGSTAHGTSASPFSGASVGGPLSSLTFTSCSEEKVVVDNAGSLSIAWTSGTNGTVTSKEAVVTVPSPFGTLNCKTGTGTDIGTLTGAASATGHATMDINGVINCGIVPSALWQGTYTVTSPTGFGVTS